MQLTNLRRICRPFVPSRIRFGLARWWSSWDPDFKKSCELGFWKARLAEKRIEDTPGYYKKFMMDMGGVADQTFFDGLVCVDVGCGPRGSLNWLDNARVCIGVDPLADAYMQFGIATHPMVYLSCPVEHVPLPSGYVDVVFAMNALDHVDDLQAACKEIRRILKPGGWFIGSLNLNEPRSITEPWTLTEDFLARELFRDCTREFYKVRPKTAPDLYRYFYAPCPEEILNQPGPKALWCRMRTPTITNGSSFSEARVRAD